MSATTRLDRTDAAPRRWAGQAAASAVVVLVAVLTAWTLTRSTALAEAEAAYGRSDLTTALRRALDHLDRRPWSEGARRIAARCLIRLDRPDLVPPYLDLSRRFDRDDAILRAQGLERAGLSLPAAEVYDLILGRVPDDPVALERLAILREAAGRPEDSLELADRLGRVPSVAARAGPLRVRALLRAGRQAEAASAFVEALRLDPGLKSIPIPALRFWGDGVDAMLQAGRGVEARRILEARVSSRGDDEILLDRLGLIAQVQGRAVDAEALWRRANAAGPTLAGPWLALGRLALNRGRAVEAIPMLKRACELDPAGPEAFEDLGRAFRDVGRLEESAGQQRRAASLREQSKAGNRVARSVPFG